MGYMRHHAILVTSWNAELMEAAHHQAQQIFEEVSPILSSSINGYRTFIVPPDGSKEFWPNSDAGDERRDLFIAWLNQQRYGDGGSPLDWVEVQYGDEEGNNRLLRQEALRINS